MVQENIKRKRRSQYSGWCLDGYTMKVRGKGNGKNGAYGDLIVQVRVLPHEKFIRRGSDLETEVTINYIKAVFGGKIKIPTLEGVMKKK